MIKACQYFSSIYRRFRYHAVPLPRFESFLMSFSSEQHAFELQMPVITCCLMQLPNSLSIADVFFLLLKRASITVALELTTKAANVFYFMCVFTLFFFMKVTSIIALGRCHFRISNFSVVTLVIFRVYFCSL